MEDHLNKLHHMSINIMAENSKFFKSIFLLLIVAFSIIACSKSDVKSNNSDANAIDITSQRAIELFKGERSMINLDKHEAYILYDTVYVNFYFNEKANKIEMQNALSCSMTIFVLKSPSMLGEYPYGELFTRENHREWKKSVIKIYSNDKLKAEIHYDGLKNTYTYNDGV